MKIDKKKLIKSIKEEINDVHEAYSVNVEYREGILEGLRLAIVLINDQLRTKDQITLRVDLENE